MNKSRITAIFFLCLILCFPLFGFSGMESESYSIPTAVLSGGGTTIDSDNYQMFATLGQASPLMDPNDPPHSTSYDLYPGFTYTLEAVLKCAWDQPPLDGDVDGLDLATFVEYVFDESELATFAVEFGRDDCGG